MGAAGWLAVAAVAATMVCNLAFCMVAVAVDMLICLLLSTQNEESAHLSVSTPPAHTH